MKKDAQIVGVWGGRGSGKSTCVKELVRDRDRLIVFDPIGDWERERGYKGVKDFSALLLALKKNWSQGFRFVMTSPRGQDPRALLERLSMILFRVQEPYFHGKDRRKITLVVEEMALSYPERTLGAKERSFMELCNLGRHYGVEIIGISQRVAEVKKNFVGNCAEHYFFRMGAAIDAQTATQFIGSRHKEALTGLRDHEYLRFSRGNVERGRNRARF